MAKVTKVGCITLLLWCGSGAALLGIGIVDANAVLMLIGLLLIASYYIFSHIAMLIVNGWEDPYRETRKRDKQNYEKYGESTRRDD